MRQMIPNNEHPDIYRKLRDGQWVRWVWDPSAQEYRPFRITESELPSGNFAILQSTGRSLPALGDRARPNEEGTGTV